MASTFTSSLRLIKQGAGENSSTWGTLFNQQFSDLIDTALSGYATKAMADADTTLTASNGVADESRAMVLNFTGALTAARNIIVPTTSKLYFIKNSTTGGFALTIKPTAGTGVSVRNGGLAVVFCDGTNAIAPITQIPTTTTINDFVVGYLEIPQNSQSAAYTLVLGDAGKHIYHPAADTTARTWVIPANASVAYPIGTTLTFVNDTGAGVVTIGITTDTLTLAPSGATGSRTLAASGVATAIKVTSTRWMISG
jgi:hypothetical protein